MAGGYYEPQAGQDFADPQIGVGWRIGCNKKLLGLLKTNKYIYILYIYYIIYISIYRDYVPHKFSFRSC